MNNKLLCRIVANSYMSFGVKNVLGDEIDLLRKGKETSIVILDRLMEIHKKIISKNDLIDLDYLLNEIKKNFEIDIKRNSELYIKILRFYVRGNYNEIIKEIMSAYDESIYKVVIAELITNAVLYKNEKRMLLFRYNTMDYLSSKMDSNIDYIYELEKETFPYLVKRKILSHEEIKSILRFIKEYFKEEVTINDLKIFGSYAKRTQDEYSDLDIFMEISENKIPIKSIVLLLKDKISTTFNASIDIIIHKKGEEYDLFDKKQLEYAISYEQI